MYRTRPYIVQNAPTNPVQAPLYGDPLIPYTCRGSRTLTVWAEADEALIRKYLAATPFEYVTNVFQVYIGDDTNMDFGGRQTPFYDSAVMVPIKYKGVYYGYMLYEYENEDYAIWAGRENWGHPKKYAQMDLVDGVDTVVATASKHGREFIRLEIDRHSCDGTMKEPEFVLAPHVNLRTIPRCDRPGIYLQQLMSRNPSTEGVTYEYIVGSGSMTLRFDGRNPLDELASSKIICASYCRTYFEASAEHGHGWAHNVETLIAPERG